MFAVASPLTDVTNLQIPMVTQKLKLPDLTRDVVRSIKKVHRHNPYGWKCLTEETPSVALMTLEAQELVESAKSQELFQEKDDQVPPAPPGLPLCNTLVQFKCHQSEYSSPVAIAKGQYVVVQGDRGIDIGVVIRVNSKTDKTYVERTGPIGSVIRHATQREVDYWAADLKEAEVVAVTYCQDLVAQHGFDMTIAHAEYQFDKKKLTFYYEARVRINFVQLLKELYREFGCRIWMEKIRIHE